MTLTKCFIVKKSSISHKMLLWSISKEFWEWILNLKLDFSASNRQLCRNSRSNLSKMCQRKRITMDCKSIPSLSSLGGQCHGQEPILVMWMRGQCHNQGSEEMDTNLRKSISNFLFYFDYDLCSQLPTRHCLQILKFFS